VLILYREDHVKVEDGMDIDDEEGGDTEIEADDTDEDMTEGPSSAPVTPKKKKKKTSLKPRKSSSLNLESLKTLTNEQAALAALESNQILHLRLRKKYYAEGLNFIRMVEGAMCVSFLLFAPPF
jgi:condensin complex subunit 1